MDRDSYVYKTPASKLVQVAAIAAEYKGRPDMLMTVIIRAQKVVSAFSKEVASVIAREMDIPMNKVYSFITFYAMLSVKPRGRYIVRMCKSAPCHVHGAQAVVQALEEGLPPEAALGTIQQATRHYAKRQMTWFRRNPDIVWLDMQGDAYAQACEAVEAFLKK